MNLKFRSKTLLFLFYKSFCKPSQLSIDTFVRKYVSVTNIKHPFSLSSHTSFMRVLCCISYFLLFYCIVYSLTIIIVLIPCPLAVVMKKFPRLRDKKKEILILILNHTITTITVKDRHLTTKCFTPLCITNHIHPREDLIHF